MEIGRLTRKELVKRRDDQALIIELEIMPMAAAAVRAEFDRFAGSIITEGSVSGSNGMLWLRAIIPVVVE